MCNPLINYEMFRVHDLYHYHFYYLQFFINLTLPSYGMLHFNLLDLCRFFIRFILHRLFMLIILLFILVAYNFVFIMPFFSSKNYQKIIEVNFCEYNLLILHYIQLFVLILLILFCVIIINLYEIVV
jgi:hypothetical protein